MIDKTKPFYLIRTPHAFTGEAYPTQYHRQYMAEVPELWRAKQSLDEAREAALRGVLDGKPSLDVYEVRLIGRVGPPAPQWQPVKQPRKRRAARKAKRAKRRG